MKFPHAPAPWTVSGKQIKAIDHGKRYTVATANNPKFTPEGNAANARLIAAAPDLLAALQMVNRVWSHDQTANLAPDSPVAVVRAAITKATGEN